MKNQNRSYKLLLGAALIAELCFFLPDVNGQTKGQVGDTIFGYSTGNIKFLPLQVTRFCLDNKENKELILEFDDTLKVSGDLPLSDGAKQFIEYLRTQYNTEIKRLTTELEEKISAYF